jgi:putative transposase
MSTIGTDGLAVKCPEREEIFARLVSQLRDLTCSGLARMINAELDAEVTRHLGRRLRDPRRASGDTQVAWQCHRCGNRQAREFGRDGHYTRRLQTTSGELVGVRVPMLECQLCGASADAEFAALPKHKHLWLDIDDEILFGYGENEALRHLAQRVAKQLGWPLSASTVQRRVHALQAAQQAWRERRWAVPPDVLMIDGIWFHVAAPTGERYTDRAGRDRPRQRKEKRVAIIVLGLWSKTGQTEILDFAIAPSEDENSVVELLTDLHLRGVTEAHVKLIASDGAGGIIAGIETVYPTVARQRCVFHKLKNVCDNITHSTHRKALAKAAAWIYEAASVDEAQQRLTRFTEEWTADEPAAVTSLQADFLASVAYLQPLGLHAPHRFRTTNAVEGGVQRHLRVKLDQATASFSARGAEAALLLASRRLNASRRGHPWIYQTQQMLVQLFGPNP